MTGIPVLRSKRGESPLSTPGCAVLHRPPGRSVSLQSWRHKARACGLAVCLCLLLSSVAHAQLTVLPTPGKAMALVTAPEAGKWVVLKSPDFLPIQPTLLDGGKVIAFEGDQGVYGVLFFPPGDGQPLVQRVVLGGAAPDPTPPEPDPPPPGGKKQVVLWVTEQQLDNLPQGQRDILNSLVFRQWLTSGGHVLLEVADPANFSGSSPGRWGPWLASVAGQSLPAISLAPVGGGPVKTYPLPASVEAAKTLIGGSGARR